MSEKNIEKFLEYIEEAEKIVFFGGAGVSTESNIPDFRSKDGLYNNRDIRFEEYSPEYLLSNDCLMKNPKVFYEFYRQKMDARNCKPNITHNALARLEEIGKLSAIVTQNIDGLHQMAGSKNVYEIHGTTHKNYCITCKKKFDENYIYDSDSSIPRCDSCNGQVRPFVTLYGEMLPDEDVNKAIKAIEEADMLIIGGTSLTVYPAAGFIRYFKGKHLTVINKEQINISPRSEDDLIINDSLGNIFKKVWEKYL